LAYDAELENERLEEQETINTQFTEEGIVEKG